LHAKHALVIQLLIKSQKTFINSIKLMLKHKYCYIPNAILVFALISLTVSYLVSGLIVDYLSLQMQESIYFLNPAKKD